MATSISPAQCSYPPVISRAGHSNGAFTARLSPDGLRAPPPLAHAHLCPHLLWPSAAFDCACVPPTLCVLSLPSFSPLLLLRNPAGSSSPLRPPDHSVLQHLLQLHSFSLWGYPSQAISSHLYSLVQTTARDSRAVSGGLFILPLACIMRLLNATYPKGNSWFPPLNLFFLKCSQP